MENNYSKSILLGVIVGLSLIVSSVVVANTFYKVKALDNSLSVTGSAKKIVTSDMGKWTGDFSREVPVADLKIGYDQMASDLKIVKKFFADNGIDEKTIVISPVYMNQKYVYNNYNNDPPKYILTQNVEVQSNDVKKITDLANKTKDMIEKDVMFSANAPEYYFTKLADIRIELLGNAIKDARARADKIAESGGKKVSTMTQAAVGVTQLLPVNSIDISDYGTYDTSSIEKEVTVTVRAAFGLN